MNPIFAHYLYLIGGILIGAGLILTLLTFVLRKNVKKVWVIYFGWLLMVPTLLLAIYLGRVATIILFGALSVWGFFEFARATGLLRDRFLSGTVLVSILGTIAAVLFPHPTGWWGLFLAMPAYTIAALLIVPVVRNRAEGQLRPVALAVVAYLYIGWMFGHIGFLANTKNAIGYLLYLVLAVQVNDVAAFISGKLFGKTKLRSEISPNKTVEGSLGALLVSMALPWFFSFSFPAEFGAIHKVLLGLIVGIGGQLGDLAISAMKRDLDVKDMGGAIPGHGGILDRIDSLIYTAPLFVHMIHYYFGLLEGPGPAAG